jgi:hypothetical protein
MFMTAVGFVIAGTVGLCAWRIYGSVLSGVHKGQTWSRRSSPSATFAAFRRRAGQKPNYELIERHEV